MEDKNEIINKFIEYIKKNINKEKINHAYLIETNLDLRFEIAENFIKTLLSYNDDDIFEMQKENDLIIIDTQNQTIKTEDIENLKKSFKTKSINNKKRIYIILESEKLNESSANKLLKFLEEPEDDIIAVLLTNNKNKVINTIVSRCQIIRFFLNINVLAKYDEEYVKMLYEFVNDIETKKEKTIAYINKYDIKKLSDRNNLEQFLKNLLYIYDDILNYKINGIFNYISPTNDIIKIAESSNIETLNKKVSAINECINRQKYNPNVKLLLDKLILLMTGVE